MVVELGEPKILARDKKLLNRELVTEGIGGQTAAKAVRHSELDLRIGNAQQPVKVEIRPEVDLFRGSHGLFRAA